MYFLPPPGAAFPYVPRRNFYRQKKSCLWDGSCGILVLLRQIKDFPDGLDYFGRAALAGEDFGNVSIVNIKAGHCSHLVHQPCLGPRRRAE